MSCHVMSAQARQSIVQPPLSHPCEVRHGPFDASFFGIGPGKMTGRWWSQCNSDPRVLIAFSRDRGGGKGACDY